MVKWETRARKVAAANLAANASLLWYNIKCCAVLGYVGQFAPPPEKLHFK